MPEVVIELKSALHCLFVCSCSSHCLVLQYEPKRILACKAAAS